MSEDRTKFETEGADLLSQVLGRHLENRGRASIVVPGAEGWRHCPSSASRSPRKIREQSSTLRNTSLKRIEAETFSPGEKAFFDAELADEL